MNVPPRLPPREPSPISAYEEGTTIHLPSLWRAVWRGRWWIFGVPLVLAALVALWTTRQLPHYEGRATLVVESEQGGSGGFLAQQMAAFAGLGGGRRSIDTDLLLLQSRQLAEAVVDSLQLRVVLLSPQTERARVLPTIETDRGDFAGRLTLTPRDDGRFDVDLEREPTFTFPVPETVGAGEALDLGGVRLVLAQTLSADAAREPIEVAIRSFRGAVDAFGKSLQVEQQGTSNVLEVAYRHPDPVLSAAATNALIHRFMEYRRTTNQEDARGAGDFLREQVALYETQLRDSEARLQAFREQESVFSPEQSAALQVRRLGELETQRAELIGQRDVLAQLVGAASTAAGEERTEEYRRLAAFPEFFRNPAVQNILQSLVELENERALLLVRRTPDNSDVRGLTVRIHQLEEELLRTSNNYLASLEEQIDAIDRTLTRTSGVASRVPAVETQFLRLTREVELLNQIYSTLQLQLKEQEVGEADRRSDIRPLDAALVPLRPSSPRPVLNLLLALVVGSMLGVGIAVARAAFDPALYSKDVVAAVAGGVPILSSIPAGGTAAPRLPGTGGNGSLGRRLIGAVLPSGGAMVGGQGLAPAGSPEAEAYTSLRTRLMNFSDPPPQLILVTSARPGDGKTTVAANLAAASARHGARTLLLEADLRKGNALPLLRLARPEASLSDVLDGTATAEDATVPFRLADRGASLEMDVIAAGQSSRHPAELLDSPALDHLLERLRTRYDAIVVDTPPLNAVSDALLLARRADATLVVTRAGATDRGDLESAVSELERVGGQVRGLVLNGFDSRSSVRYSYGRE